GRLAGGGDETGKQRAGAWGGAVDGAYFHGLGECGRGQREALRRDAEEYRRERIGVLLARRRGELQRPLLEIAGGRRPFEQAAAGARVDLAVAAVGDARQLGARAGARDADMAPAVVHPTYPTASKPWRAPRRRRRARREHRAPAATARRRPKNAVGALAPNEHASGRAARGPEVIARSRRGERGRAGGRRAGRARRR